MRHVAVLGAGIMGCSAALCLARRGARITLLDGAPRPCAGASRWNEGKIHLDFAGAQPSDEVADSVVRSLEKNRTEAAVGFASWWVWFGKRFFPRAVRFFMQRKVWKYARRERDELAPRG